MDAILEFKLFYGISSVIPIYETILNRKHGPDKKHWMYDANGQVLTLFPTTTFNREASLASVVVVFGRYLRITNEPPSLFRDKGGGDDAPSPSTRRQQ